MRYLGQFSLADLITTIGIVLGFLSTVYARSDPLLSAGLILIAVIMDALDGMVARMYDSSEDGKMYDSMGDIVSFSVAPSYLVYNNLSTLSHELVILICLSFLLTSIIHLRKYLSSGRCKGCQTTISAVAVSYSVYIGDPIIVISTSILFSVLMIVDSEYPENIHNGLKIFLGLVIFSSVLMNVYMISNPNILNYPMMIIVLIYGVVSPLRHD